MKKLVLYTFGILSTFLLILNSCTNEDLTFLDDLEKGAFVKFVTAPPSVVGVNEISEVVYSGEIIDPDGNVAKYDLVVSALLSGVEYGPAAIGSYTSFPVNINLTANDFASLLGVSISDISFGDQFFFEGTVTSKDGTIYYGEVPEIIDDKFVPNGLTQENLYSLTTGYKNGFLFNFTIGCPGNTFSASELVGTYEIMEEDMHGFLTGEKVQVVAGPGENQLTIKDPFVWDEVSGINYGYEVVIDIDPVTNEITVAKQEAWDSGTYGYPYGVASVAGAGTLFGCIETIYLEMDNTVAAGSFGIGVYKIKKVN